MASEHVTISAAAPVYTADLSESATTLSSTASAKQIDSDPTRTKSLKRSRPEHSQNPSNLTSIANAGLGIPSPKSPRSKGAFSPGFSATPLTGAAAISDERRKKGASQGSQPGPMSENPGYKARSTLMAGGGPGMSKLQDAPVPTAVMSEGMSTAANAISIPSPVQFDEKPETSPASVTSLASLRSTGQTVTASSTVVASPAAMTGLIEAESRDARPSSVNQLPIPLDEQSSNRALTFPGNILSQSDSSRGPSRGMSLPMPGQNQQLAPRSPSQKKHKCPYCETEFTRHHNLKSHLLTHSQEKPYVCQSCTKRFRRLHDLKRHMKLHTGERPHICPKCDRKFARGDALARHSKGQGGCAGRRASMGSFGADDDFDDSNAGDGEDGGMDGIMYTNGTPRGNEADMSEEDRRRFSLPSIKAPHATGNQGSQDNYSSHSRTPSTYPPAGPRPAQSTGGLYPPNTDRGLSSGPSTSPSLQHTIGSGITAKTSMSSLPLSTGGGSMFSQSGMTESPKPLSPAGIQSHQLGHDSSHINRQRSPSLTTQFQQQHFGRRQSERVSPPGMSLPSPHGTSQGPKLPALTGLAPPEQRFTLPSQTPSQQNPASGSHSGQQGQPAPMATSPSTIFQPPGGSVPGRGAPSGPTHSQGSASGDSSNNLFAAGERGVWAYVQTLEDKVKQLSEKVYAMENKEKSQEEKINRLSDEVFSLRNQLNAQSQSQRIPVPGHS